jgi:hypothetical protein
MNLETTQPADTRHLPGEWRDQYFAQFTGRMSCGHAGAGEVNGVG